MRPRGSIAATPCTILRRVKACSDLSSRLGDHALRQFCCPRHAEPDEATQRAVRKSNNSAGISAGKKSIPPQSSVSCSSSGRIASEHERRNSPHSQVEACGGNAPRSLAAGVFLSSPIPNCFRQSAALVFSFVAIDAVEIRDVLPIKSHPTHPSLPVLKRRRDTRIRLSSPRLRGKQFPSQGAH